MDFEHSYWKYAELVNGRLAMVGVIILFFIHIQTPIWLFPKAVISANIITIAEKLIQC